MGLWEWGNFGSHKVRSVRNVAIFNLFASNLDCTHDFWVSPPEKLKNCLWDRFGHFWGTDPFSGHQKVRGLINFGSGCSLHLQYFRCVLHNEVYNVTMCKFTISVRKGTYGNGAILGSQKVRSVLNRAIFNRFASILDCAHDFLVSPPEKQEIPIWGQFVPFLGY